LSSLTAAVWPSLAACKPGQEPLDSARELWYDMSRNDISLNNAL